MSTAPVDFSGYIAKGRCECCGRVKPTWTPEEIVAAMRAWAHKHGRPPTSHTWHRASRENPSTQRVTTVFGSFKRAQRAAGLATVRSLTGVMWTRSAIRQAIFEWRFEHGRLPRADEWRGSEDPRWPSTSTVIRVFGSWNRAFEFAGYEPTRRRVAV